MNGALDVRSILRVVDGGGSEAAGVCRSVGCAQSPATLGFCESCFAEYERRCRRNSLRYAVFVEEICAKRDLGLGDLVLRRARAGELIEAVASGLTENVALVLGVGEAS